MASVKKSWADEDDEGFDFAPMPSLAIPYPQTTQIPAKTEKIDKVEKPTKPAWKSLQAAPMETLKISDSKALGGVNPSLQEAKSMRTMPVAKTATNSVANSQSSTGKFQGNQKTKLTLLKDAAILPSSNGPPAPSNKKGYSALMSKSQLTPTNSAASLATKVSPSISSFSTSVPLVSSSVVNNVAVVNNSSIVNNKQPYNSLNNSFSGNKQAVATASSSKQSFNSSYTGTSRGPDSVNHPVSPAIKTFKEPTVLSRPIIPKLIHSFGHIVSIRTSAFGFLTTSSEHFPQMYFNLSEVSGGAPKVNDEVEFDIITEDGKSTAKNIVHVLPALIKSGARGTIAKLPNSTDNWAQKDRSDKALVSGLIDSFNDDIGVAQYEFSGLSCIQQRCTWNIKDLVEFDIYQSGRKELDNIKNFVKNVRLVSFFESPERFTGRVTSVHKLKYFGFISVIDLPKSEQELSILSMFKPTELFFHFSEVFSDNLSDNLDKVTISTGSKVSFNKITRDGKINACRIMCIEDQMIVHQFSSSKYTAPIHTCTFVSGSGEFTGLIAHSIEPALFLQYKSKSEFAPGDIVNYSICCNLQSGVYSASDMVLVSEVELPREYGVILNGSSTGYGTIQCLERDSKVFYAMNSNSIFPKVEVEFSVVNQNDRLQAVRMKVLPAGTVQFEKVSENISYGIVLKTLKQKAQPSDFGFIYPLTQAQSSLFMETPSLFLDQFPNLVSENSSFNKETHLKFSWNDIISVFRLGAGDLVSYNEKVSKPSLEVSATKVNLKRPVPSPSFIFVSEFDDNLKNIAVTEEKDQASILEQSNRQRGVLKSWKAEKEGGFGFIRIEHSTTDMYVSWGEFIFSNTKPTIGMELEFDLDFNPKISKNFAARVIVLPPGSIQHSRVRSEKYSGVVTTLASGDKKYSAPEPGKLIVESLDITLQYNFDDLNSKFKHLKVGDNVTFQVAEEIRAKGENILRATNISGVRTRGIIDKLYTVSNKNNGMLIRCLKHFPADVSTVSEEGLLSLWDASEIFTYIDDSEELHLHDHVEFSFGDVKASSLENRRTAKNALRLEPADQRIISLSVASEKESASVTRPKVGQSFQAVISKTYGAGLVQYIQTSAKGPDGAGFKLDRSASKAA